MKLRCEGSVHQPALNRSANERRGTSLVRTDLLQLLTSSEQRLKENVTRRKGTFSSFAGTISCRSAHTWRICARFY